MKKKVALKALNERLKEYHPDKPLETWRKGDIKDLIRIMADNDEGFENIIFEVGCNIVAKAFKKQLGEKEGYHN